ncbi:glycoside hydrolase domain-containing protein [Peribacillus sp. NPDC096447]|uniref:glycoside hydrolase domain-containing protein n=1 Tax=Peribacillus sp. NPDC096447 TaxID=3364394 RepID=UPI00382D93DB
MAIYEWGVDSAENVTEDLFQCVIRNFGYPKFWGRYLLRVPGASEGLTKQEISFIRSKGVKLLPIYNSFQDAKGYRQGRVAANNAVFNARKLGIPKGVPLFANVERFFQVDNEWIQGWTEAMFTSGYKSGIYNDPVVGGFNKAFCNAAKENEKVKIQNILWSAEPELHPSGPRNPPNYKPKAPNCGGNVWAWQYSRKVTQCPIDTNLANSSLVNILWS